MHQIGLNNNPNCVCGEIQTHQHVLNCQMIGIRGNIRTVDEDFRMWLDDSLLRVIIGLMRVIIGLINESY